MQINQAAHEAGHRSTDKSTALIPNKPQFCGWFRLNSTNKTYFHISVWIIRPIYQWYHWLYDVNMTFYQHEMEARVFFENWWSCRHLCDILLVLDIHKKLLFWQRACLYLEANQFKRYRTHMLFIDGFLIRGPSLAADTWLSGLRYNLLNVFFSVRSGPILFPRLQTI